MVITLIGFRGVGKSSVAPQLAARLGWEWIDADREVADRAGKSIPDIFSQDGEPVFRKWEADVMNDLLHRDCLVVAAGGGAVMNDQTRRLMQEAGPVVWLQAALETIWSRIAATLGGEGGRPALTEHDPRTEVEILLNQREPVYAAAASVTIRTGDHSIAAIVDEIVAQLPAQSEWPE
ncbi:MAG: shikimate kinase [Planctomycetaceae bacterium]|nr:shikimate kinase [Planctomycetaceae bacterium]